jgi:glycosyltransferase involved in cell wall biosynthesis
MKQQKHKKLISILVPCYNEQDSIEQFIQQVSPVMDSLMHDYELIFIDDGSVDGSLILLRGLCEKNKHIRAISLSRNFGKEAALTAGLDFASGDAVIPIDVDLQDPVELIPSMVQKWQAGAEVVMAKRVERKADTMFRRLTASGFYKLMDFLSSTPMPRDVGDYRLMDKVVVQAIRQLPEKNRFMKGLLSWPGYQNEIIEYSRPERARGKSKWQLWKLFNHALDGIFSFSTAPLRMWTYFGLILSFFSLAYLLFIVLKTWILGVDLPGYASILSIILFFSGVNLIGLGILGEYLGRVFIEVKQRPVYLIKKKIGF